MLYIECLRHNGKRNRVNKERNYACNLYAERTEADHEATTYKYLRSPPLRSFYVELIFRWDVWTLFS